jgi:hypothetical protein
VRGRNGSRAADDFTVHVTKGALFCASDLSYVRTPICFTSDCTNCHMFLLVLSDWGASWQVTTNDAATLVDGGMMDLDIATVSEQEGRFLVAFSDGANKGAMTAVEGQVSVRVCTDDERVCCA